MYAKCEWAWGYVEKVRVTFKREWEEIIGSAIFYYRFFLKMINEWMGKKSWRFSRTHAESIRLVDQLFVNMLKSLKHNRCVVCCFPCNGQFLSNPSQFFARYHETTNKLAAHTVLLFLRKCLFDVKLFFIDFSHECAFGKWLHGSIVLCCVNQGKIYSI